MSPLRVDVSGGPAEVSAAAPATDRQSAVVSAQVTWTSPSGLQSVSASLSRTKGTPVSGRWTGDAQVPMCAENGAWAASARGVDVAGNVKEYAAAEAAGWAKDLTVTGGQDSMQSGGTGSGSTMPAEGDPALPDDGSDYDGSDYDADGLPSEDGLHQGQTASAAGGL